MNNKISVFKATQTVFARYQVLLEMNYQDILKSSIKRKENNEDNKTMKKIDTITLDKIEHLIAMCQTAIKGSESPEDECYMTEDKLSRWLGYVQGIMIELELIKIEDERNTTREIFHLVYEELGIPKSKSIDVKIFDDSFKILE